MNTLIRFFLKRLLYTEDADKSQIQRLLEREQALELFQRLYLKNIYFGPHSAALDSSPPDSELTPVIYTEEEPPFKRMHYEVMISHKQKDAAKK